MPCRAFFLAPLAIFAGCQAPSVEPTPEPTNAALSTTAPEGSASSTPLPAWNFPKSRAKKKDQPKPPSLSELAAETGNRCKEGRRTRLFVLHDGHPLIDKPTVEMATMTLEKKGKNARKAWPLEAALKLGVDVTKLVIWPCAGTPIEIEPAELRAKHDGQPRHVLMLTKKDNFKLFDRAGTDDERIKNIAAISIEGTTAPTHGP